MPHLAIGLGLMSYGCRPIVGLYHRLSFRFSKQLSVLSFGFSSRFFATFSAMSSQTKSNVQSTKNAEVMENCPRKEQQNDSFSHLWHLNLHLTEDSTPYCATVLYPGISPESVSSKGKPSLQVLLKILSAGRLYALHTPSRNNDHAFFQFNEATKDYITFISSTAFNISRRMYNDFSVLKSPLEIQVQGGHIGRTSFSSVTSMVSTGDSEREKLITQINQVVLIDKNTRRPHPFEDKWRDKYQSHCIRGEPLIIRKQETPASGPLSVYEVKVAWSDTDLYNHTNFTSYARFAVDATHDALRQGKLGERLTAADMDAGISKMEASYMGESVEGDVLRVSVWFPENSHRTVMCSMEKNEKVINQMMLTFYDPLK